MFRNSFLFSGLALPLASWLMLVNGSLAVCDDDGSDDSGNLRANVSNSACVNGIAQAAITDGGGGGVNVAPPTGVPPAGLKRSISGTSTSTFTNGASFNAPIRPGQQYNVTWTKGTTSSVSSLHTLVEPENLPGGYKVQVNAGDGNGWVSGNKLDMAASTINVSTVQHSFRVVRPIREAGKVEEIMVTRPVFAVQRGSGSGGQTLTGVYGIDADGDTYADAEPPVARFLMPLGAALESGKPITAGDLILHCPLWRPSGGVVVNRALLSYEGVDRTATGVVVLTDGAGQIRQIRAPEIFVDAVTINASQFQLRLYGPSAVAGQTPSPFFAPTGTPHAVWTMQSVGASGGFAAGIRVIEAKDGVTVRSVDMAALKVTTKFESRRIEGAETEHVVSSVYAFPNGHTETIGGQTFLVGSTYGWTQGRQQTVTVTRNGGQIRKTVERHLFAAAGMGEGLLDRRQTFGSGAGQELLTQQFNIWNSSYASAYGSMMGKPLLQYYPDGSWERYQYSSNGSLTKVYRPYEGSPARPWDATDTNCVVETYSYTTDPVTGGGGGYSPPAAFVTYNQVLPQSKETKILGTLVEKTVYGYTEKTSAGQPVLETVTRVYRNATDYDESVEERFHQTAVGVPANMPVSRTSEAGAKDTFSYERGTFDRVNRTFAVSATGLDYRMFKVQGSGGSPAGIANKTTRMVTVRNAAGTTLQESTQIYDGSAYDPATVTDYFYDACHRLTEVRKDGRTIRSIVHNGLVRTITEEDGVVGIITEDLNGRITSDAKSGGPTATTVYSGNTKTTTIGTLVRSETTDQIGRVTSVTETNGRTYSFSYPNNGRDLQSNYPGGKAVLETRKVGGRVASVTNASGQKIVPRHYAYGVNTNGSRWMKESLVTASNVRWSTATSDWRDNEILREMPAPSGTGTLQVTRVYDDGLLRKEEVGATAGLAAWLFEYNALGELHREGRDLNENGTLDPVSNDTIIEHDRRFEKIGGDWYGVREVRQYQQNGVGTPVTLQIVKSRLSAFSGGIAGKVITVDANGVETVVTKSIDRPNKTVTTVTTRGDRSDSATQIEVNGLLVSSTTSGDTQAETYQYDSLERLWKSVDARTGAVTRREYNAQGLLANLVEEAVPRTTSWSYYPTNHANAGEIQQLTNADNKSTFYSYNDRGQLVRVWGAASVPEEYEYNTYGELSKTTSYRAGSGWTSSTWPSGTTGTGDATTINYFPATGLLKERIDALTRKTEYTWRDNGNIHTRKWARNITTTWGYDANGLETSRSYSDGSTPPVSITRDRAGRTGTMTDSAGLKTYGYNAASLVDSISIAGSGILSGFTTSYGRDGFGRPETTDISFSGTSLYSQTRTWQSGSGRFHKVISGPQEAEYVYATNSNFIREIIWRESGVAKLGQSRVLDDLDRVSSVSHVKAPSIGGPVLVGSQTYVYDVLNRRDITTFEDGSFWDYGYNDRGELNSADKKVPGGGAPYAGRQFRFSHDNAGNRLTMENGGNVSGSGRRTHTSTSNALNQRASQTTPATFDVSGSSSSVTVTVNGSSATRQGDYFHSEVTAANGSTPAWTSVTVNDGGTPVTGHVLTPPASVTPSYDHDGNLLSDGVWAYTWDAENRLIKAVRSLPGIPYREIRYDYDGNNRLIRKQVFHASGGAAVSTEKYLNESGRRLLAVNGSNQALQSFHWGLDVSRTQDGAAGAGGLLWIKDHSSGGIHLVCTDANANVTHLVDPATGAATAAYEYSPHGELLRATGPYAFANPFRFSTKAQDNDSGLLDYGRRFFKPNWGTWLSRDPLGDIDGLNQYGFCGNDPVNRIDVGGYYGWKVWRDVWLNPKAWLDSGREAISSGEVMDNYKSIGRGVYNGGKGLVEGIASIPELADFVANGGAADMIDRLRNDPDYRDALMKELGKEFCDWLKKIQTNDGAFEAYGEAAFGILSGAGAAKVLQAAKKLRGMNRFAKPIPEDAPKPSEKTPGIGCFVAGTLVAVPDGTQTIESLRLGQRVLTSDQQGATSDTAVEQASWRQISLRLQNPDSPSTWMDVEILRPLAWIEANGARAGSVIHFRLEELGIEGPAEIHSVSPCPVIESGAGRVVLATITHVNGDLRVLRTEGGDEITLTGSHRLFSLDRGDWIASKDLRVGETLRTKSGQERLASIECQPGNHRVYNIEVETDHCYFVGVVGVLSHNLNPCTEGGPTYEIQDGVRRSKASDTLGRETIDAEIVDEFDNVIDRKEVPIKDLRSPKDKIEARNITEMERYADVQDATQKGTKMPPIRVTPGDRGIPIRQVGFDYGR